MNAWEGGGEIGSPFSRPPQAEYGTSLFSFFLRCYNVHSLIVTLPCDSSVSVQHTDAYMYRYYQ